MGEHLMLKRYMLVIGILSVIFIVGCSDNGTTGEVVASTQDTASSENVVDVNVKLFRFGFDPKTITVKQGQTVRLTAESLDIPHGLAISKYGVNMNLDGLRSQTVEFVANKAGRFPIYCSVPCGSGHGTMQGMLIVE